MSQAAYTLNKVIKKEIYLHYLVHLPPGAENPQKGQVFPTIFFLHGAGERGDDPELLKLHGIPKIVEQQPEFPYITISPQCPLNTWWPSEIDALDTLFDEIVRTYPVDLKRVYLTGLSMGGFGTWHWAVQRPQRFAAIAPICGGGHWANGFPEKVLRIRHLPVWAFHGRLDPIVKPRETSVLVRLLRKNGGNVRHTVYPDADHDSWTVTYNNPELYRWFDSHHLP